MCTVDVAAAGCCRVSGRTCTRVHTHTQTHTAISNIDRTNSMASVLCVCVLVRDRERIILYLYVGQLAHKEPTYTHTDTQIRLHIVVACESNVCVRVCARLDEAYYFLAILCVRAYSRTECAIRIVSKRGQTHTHTHSHSGQTMLGVATSLSCANSARHQQDISVVTKTAEHANASPISFSPQNAAFPYRHPNPSSQGAKSITHTHTHTALKMQCARSETLNDLVRLCGGRATAPRAARAVQCNNSKANIQHGRI